MTCRIHLVAAARPNFMKVAPLFHELLRQEWCSPVLVHTGQHYDADMSSSFLRDLGLPEPHHHLGVGSGSHAEQTASVMTGYERVLVEDRPDAVVVVGDVNSTMACALTATKLHVLVAHLEAGLRSRDRTMPEEINRVVTDAVADLLLTPSADADANLLSEGVPAERIVRVGNIMIDSLEMCRSRIEAERTAEWLGLTRGVYCVTTLHRPSNVDDKSTLETLVQHLVEVASVLPIVFPLHPRTRLRLEEHGMLAQLQANDGVHLAPPLPYFEFLSLVFSAALVITDSGGVQEETTYLGIPCLTLRTTTERPITITHGTNRLVTAEVLTDAVRSAVTDPRATNVVPELWDGRTAPRVAAALREWLDG